jgi:16S rRNA C967 or C1407 C5-methylase (RsmB/RsmF family)
MEDYTFCSKCETLFLLKNFNKHIKTKIHRELINKDSNRKHCPPCFKTVAISNWEKHIQTETHKRNVRENELTPAKRRQNRITRQNEREPFDTSLLEKLKRIDEIEVVKKFNPAGEIMPTTIQLRINKVAKSVNSYNQIWEKVVVLIPDQCFEMSLS